MKLNKPETVKLNEALSFVFLRLTPADDEYSQWRVEAIDHENNDRRMELGTIHYSSDSKQWTVYKLGPSYDWSLNKVFDDFRVSDRVILARLLYFTMISIEANPLPGPCRLYFEQEARRLTERYQEILSEFIDLQNKRNSLGQLAKAYGMDLRITDAEMADEVADLLAFFQEHNDVIYEKLGKDWARSLRALVRCVVTLVDPEAAQEI